jgi:hypothetical protein
MTLDNRMHLRVKVWTSKTQFLASLSILAGFDLITAAKAATAECRRDSHADALPRAKALADRANRASLMAIETLGALLDPRNGYRLPTA